ncbi:NAD(P)-dependent oxidoreductase [Candidatus Manganitrophus noduliformans]|uniref:NAD(P)-dependent oxidoreductase n=1 Tax=Candidatus Manganitrophus noduliformans TaxID=2606439 RepID=A0A7X6DNM1_9BACT|nr:NAD(P)-dependent oxidoreductase [Candidatus Manganitrophus noduliformans]NKE70576.1 NAD(P)-dependent oxidoreductase [Candidatus Manganitrophus noduliformans]
MTTSAFQIGFVGVGRMGANMARRLKDKGYRLTAVYDIDRARSASLAKELGCSPASTPAEVAKGSNTVMTVVTDDAAMRVLFSESDPAGLLPFGDGRLFINCATLSPEVHVEIEERAKKQGAQTLEACMASSIPQAREGTLYLMCGGERAVFDRAKPLLEDLGRSIRYIGKAGEAAKVKALVNMVMNINTAALAEGLGLGAALGLDLTLLREVFSQTGAASRVLETDGTDMQNREHDCYFSAAHAAKDSGIALTLAEAQGIDLPLAKATYAQYRRLIDIGKGELDKSAVAELTFPGRG